ncbi:methyl-CpG-binding domain-containing protein 11-like protein [Carex littledalei]|uniref:Methyl-CpG-binding domain-containing protein 11-like protein n=1 Tax=Carex littledalei TaxID=544730 RepID=A0A833QYD2_9POAL|nr:methyl-CpG-binding domain-containing protein 11-like protein [Carex littledalei]
MATEEVKVVEESPSEKKVEEAEGDVSVELPAPSAWKKKVLPKKGRTPGRGDVIFIAPSGEEIKTKRQLDQYLKSNPGGPASSEFDWSTGDTPRRSVRISEKAKTTVSPEDERPKKRGRKASSEEKKREHENKDTEEKEKEADAEATDEKVDDAEPIKEAGEAVNPAAETAAPDDNSGEKVEENNEVKPGEKVEENNEVKPVEKVEENNEVKAEEKVEEKPDEPADTDTAPLENNVGGEAGPHEGSDVNGNNH